MPPHARRDVPCDDIAGLRPGVLRRAATTLLPAMAER
jgi:hypothetical protein